MEISTIQPRHPLLEKYIDYYYFFSSSDPGYSTNYWAFPHTSTSFNIHKNIDCRIGLNSVRISSSVQPNYRCIIQGFRRYPLQVELGGILDKVTIVFKPLAINHFLGRPFYEVTPGHSCLFEDWDNDSAYHLFIHEFYTVQDEMDRCAILEDYLVSICDEKKECLMLSPAVRLLLDFTVETTVEDIAAGVHQSVRTFNRMFRKYSGITPSGFRKVARFRKALNEMLSARDKMNMTTIAHSNNYYDQSYMVKIYNELTGTNPRSFLKTIRPLADQKIIFRFE